MTTQTTPCCFQKTQTEGFMIMKPFHALQNHPMFTPKSYTQEASMTMEPRHDLQMPPFNLQNLSTENSRIVELFYAMKVS